MKNNRKVLYIAGFLFSINIALTSYVSSSFLNVFINEKYLGIIYAISAILTIWGLFEIPKIMSKYGNTNTSIFSSVLSFVSLIVLSFGNSSYAIVPAFMMYFITSNFLIMNFDIFIEELSPSKHIGKSRGIYLLIINGAWVLAQLVSGSIIAKSSYQGIFLFSASLIILTTGMFILFFQKFQDPLYKKISILKNLRFFIKQKNIFRIYILNFLLKFFFAWMVIYTPIYLHEYILFSWDKMGIIFTVMLLPFVILDYPMGKLSDKIGEKKMLILSFTLTAIFVFMIPLIKNHSLFVWVGILFFTRVGAAIIEIMSESYFFKAVTVDNSEAISFFRNTGPMSYLIAPIIATIILATTPSFKYIFYILTPIMLLGTLISLRLKDIK